MTLTPAPLGPSSAPSADPVSMDASSTPAPTSPPTSSTTSTSEVNAAVEAEQIVANITTITSDVASAVSVIATPTLWTAILGFFSALPDLVKLALGVIALFNRISGNNPKAAIAVWGQFFSQLGAAKTKEDNQNAAKTFADSVSNLPS